MAVASPPTFIPSHRTLERDIEKQFLAEREELRLALHTHMEGGGRFSLITDGWRATNSTDFAAVTIHWIDLGWERHNSKLLDMIHLEEPVHSRQYLAEKLYKSRTILASLAPSLRSHAIMLSLATQCSPTSNLGTTTSTSRLSNPGISQERREM